MPTQSPKLALNPQRNGCEWARNFRAGGSCHRAPYGGFQYRNQRTVSPELPQRQRSDLLRQSEPLRASPLPKGTAASFGEIEAARVRGVGTNWAIHGTPLRPLLRFNGRATQHWVPPACRCTGVGVQAVVDARQRLRSEALVRRVR